MDPPSLPKEVRCILYNDMEKSTDKVSDARREGQDDAHNTRVDLWYRRWQASLEAGGAVFVKFLGDGLLATFHDALDALLSVVHTYATLAAQEDCPQFPVRFGLHIGAVS